MSEPGIDTTSDTPEGYENLWPDRLLVALSCFLILTVIWKLPWGWKGQAAVSWALLYLVAFWRIKRLVRSS